MFGIKIQPSGVPPARWIFVKCLHIILTKIDRFKFKVDATLLEITVSILHDLEAVPGCFASLHKPCTAPTVSIFYYFLKVVKKYILPSLKEGASSGGKQDEKRK